MSWHTDNAVKRIFNSFKRLKNQIFEQDAEALELLSNEIAGYQKGYVNDNILFAKLLNYTLKTELINQGSMKMAIKKIDSVLKTPLSHHTEFLRMTLNEMDLREYLESLKINLNNYTNSQDKEIDKILLDNQKEVREKLTKFWNYDKVEKSIYNTANEFLKDINNYN